MNYRRLQAKSDDAPRAVVASLDETELIKLRETMEENGYEEMQAYENLVKAQSEGTHHGLYEFEIPGGEVGEFSDVAYDIDNGKLEDLIDEWNQEMINELDNDS